MQFDFFPFFRWLRFFVPILSLLLLPPSISLFLSLNGHSEKCPRDLSECKIFFFFFVFNHY